MVPIRVEAWRVHDTGLVAVPSRFRRLGGQVRHHRGQGPAWPDRIRLVLDDEVLQVESAGGPVGSWDRAEVHAHQVAAGPPVSLVIEIPGGAHLLAAAASADLDALLTALGP